MALVFSHFVLAVTLTDREADETTRRYSMLPAITDYADAVTLAGTVLTALGNMTYDTVVKYAIESIYANDALALPTDAAAQNFNQALLIYQMDGLPVHEATQSIPAPQQGIFISPSGPNGKVVDTADAAVVAWRQLFQNDAGLTLSDGEQVDILLRGHRRSTKSSSGN